MRELEEAARSVPAASIAVRIGGRPVLEVAAGVAELGGAAAHPGLPFDLASLTKPLAAVTVIGGWFDAGRAHPSDRVSRWVPEAHPELTFAHLLGHVGGYPPWAPVHQPHAPRDTIVDRAIRSADAPPGGAARYSDLGFLTLLRAIERVGDAPLDAQLAPWLDRAEVELRWGWPGAAATERGTPRGVVHDPIARAMGGVSSHAGLFGAASDVARLAEQVVDAADGRRSALPGRFLAPLWARGHRGGWDHATPGGATGARWPAGTVGHLGYTGTSVWIARRERVVVALLTNRVHPDDAKDAIRIVRPRIHDAVAEELGW